MPNFFLGIADSVLQSRKNKKLLKQQTIQTICNLSETCRSLKILFKSLAHIYLSLYIFQVPQRRRGDMGAVVPSFSGIAFCQENFWIMGRFLGNLLLYHYPRHPKLFWPGTSRNNSYNLASSGYGYSDFPLTHISSQLSLA